MNLLKCTHTNGFYKQQKHSFQQVKTPLATKKIKLPMIPKLIRTYEL